MVSTTASLRRPIRTSIANSSMAGIPLWQEFLYDRKAQDLIDIWNNSKPSDEILSIPI